MLLESPPLLCTHLPLEPRTATCLRGRLYSSVLQTTAQDSAKTGREEAMRCGEALH